MKKFILSVLIFSGVATASSAPSAKGPRYFLEGDGTVKIVSAKSGQGGPFTYRDKSGSYDLSTLDRINKVFGVIAPSEEFIAPRLIALLDYLQDQLKGGTIRIVSGYRSPNYNEGLRKKGRLAARTSMHVEGMAADIDMDGVDGKTLWEYVRGLDCCGAGYYHGTGIHIDVGPSRFWDEKTTGVEKDLGGQNKLILLRTNFDYYDKGEVVYATLGRITDYPIGIKPKIRLEDRKGKEVASAELDLKGAKPENGCVILPDRTVARSLKFDLPEGTPIGEKLAVRMDFCQKPFPEMPDSTLSNSILIRD
jgi:uncharacterized protein YcbK (DUF882 family)